MRLSSGREFFRVAVRSEPTSAGCTRRSRLGSRRASVITARHGDADHGVAALTGLWQLLSEGSSLFLPPLESLKSVNADERPERKNRWEHPGISK